MAPTFTIVAGAPKADLFVVPVFSGARLGPGAQLVDDAIGGTLAEFMQETDFDGTRGEVLAVPTGGRLGARAALLLGVGDEETFDAAALRRAGAVLAKRASRVASVATTLLDAVGPDVDRRPRRRRSPKGVASVAHSSACGTSRRPRRRAQRVLVIGRSNAKVRAGSRRAHHGGGAVGAISSTNRRGEVAGRRRRPRPRVARIRVEGQGLRGRAARARAHGWRARRRERFRSAAPVPAARCDPPIVPGTLALVGKGVVFDSGGLSLKTAGGMETMKTDMSGAAAVIAAMSTLRDLGVKTRVIGYVPLVENMPSGAAMRPGDVLTMRNGKTVEVLNTDAEGRLILADACRSRARRAPTRSSTSPRSPAR